MSRSPFDLEFDDLPPRIPIFPLPAVLLLPRSRLPLNIFEPRYLNMTLDALATPTRVIGMVQPLEAAAGADEPPVYATGGAGRISAFSETGDGRLLITLTGVCRFRIGEELSPHRGYRRVKAEYADFRADLAPETYPPLDRDSLFACLKEYFKRHGIQADWETIRNLPDEQLVAALAMSCPFEPGEKQALLEAPTLPARHAALVTILEMALHGAPASALGVRQ
ncbi:MAG: LON peptidase substrate-binding domain-containing protein [Proteobacteria bacterium]|nr:LON peptidase substrate-binding domain-containing protein [Pseudomonadota bacterium]